MSAAIAAALVSLGTDELHALLVCAARERDDLAATNPNALGRLWIAVSGDLADLAAAERDKRSKEWPAFEQDVAADHLQVIAVELPGREDAP